jgi:hypothetical protein
MRTQTADFVGDKDITRYASTKYDTALDRAQEQWCLDTKALWKDQAYTTAAGDADYDLPTDMMYEDYVLHDGNRLKPISRYEASVRFGQDWATQSGTPSHYIIDPEEAVKELLLVPIPVEVKSVLLRYFPLPASMSSDSSVALNSSALLAQFHIGICAYAGWLLLMGEDPTPAIVQKMGQLQSIYSAGVSLAIETFRNTVSAGLKIRGSAKWS